MSKDKKDHMGGNKVRDGGAVEKISKRTGVDRDVLKHAVEELKPPGAGTQNLSFKQIESIANDIKKR